MQAAATPLDASAGDAVPEQEGGAALAVEDQAEPAAQQHSSSGAADQVTTAAAPAAAAAVEKRTIAADALDCIVCRDVVVGAHALSCSHVACGACLLQWFESSAIPTCPCCRSVVSAPPVPLLLIDNAVSDLQLLTGSEPQRLAERAQAWQAIKADTEKRWQAQFGGGDGGGGARRDTSAAAVSGHRRSGRGVQGSSSGSGQRRRQQQPHATTGSGDAPRPAVHLLAGLRSVRQHRPRGGRQLGIDAFLE